MKIKPKNRKERRQKREKCPNCKPGRLDWKPNNFKELRCDYCGYVTKSYYIPTAAEMTYWTDRIPELNYTPEDLYN